MGVILGVIPFSYMVTRNGVYYDLMKSNYRYKVLDTQLTFVFSSDLHKVKFMEQFRENRNAFNVKLMSRYRLNVEMTTLPDIILYKKIESRGFLIINERGQHIWLENLLLGGEKAMPKS